MFRFLHQQSKYIVRICYGILVANAVSFPVFVVFMLTLTPDIWVHWGVDQEAWILKCLVLITCAAILYTYSLFATIRRQWLHGLYIYGGLTIVLYWDIWMVSPIYYIFTASLISIEILTFNILFSPLSISKGPWYSHFISMHYIILPAFMLIGIIMLEYFLLSLLVFFLFNLINLVLSRLIQNSHLFWGYFLGVGEFIIFIFGIFGLEIITNLPH